MITTYNMLLFKAVKGGLVQKKRQHSPANTYLSTPLGQMPFHQVGNPPILHATITYCLEFNSEWNGTLARSL